MYELESCRKYNRFGMMMLRYWWNEEAQVIVLTECVHAHSTQQQQQQKTMRTKRRAKWNKERRIGKKPKKVQAKQNKMW